MTINRRDFLKVSGASAASTLITGCATQGGAPAAMKGNPKVVVVGAGFGGATCAKYIRKWGPNIEVTIV